MVRPIDDLGRIVIPKEMRTILAINRGDGLEILMQGNDIILRKYASICFVCNGIDGVEKQNRTYLCGECRSKLEVAEVAEVAG